MAFIDFRVLREKVTIQQVIEWRNIEVKRFSNDLKGECPICGSSGNGRAFTVSLIKGLWNCFGECKSGGDMIELVAKLDNVDNKTAAASISDHFLTERVTKVPDDVLKPLDYLQADHDLVRSLGLPKEVCEALGAGYAGKGTLSGRLLIPLRTETGKLLGYIYSASIWMRLRVNLDETRRPSGLILTLATQVASVLIDGARQSIF